MGSFKDSLDTYLYQSVIGGQPAPTVKSAEGLYFTLEDGQKVLDATGGAAVSAIGHGNKTVRDAILRQLDAVTYAHPGFFSNSPARELADWLVSSTGGQMSRACILGSGLLPPNPFPLTWTLCVVPLINVH